MLKCKNTNRWEWYAVIRIRTIRALLWDVLRDRMRDNHLMSLGKIMKSLQIQNTCYQLSRRRAITWVLMQAEADNDALSVVSFTSDTRLPLSQLLLQWTASQSRRILFETTTPDAVNTPFTQQSSSVSERWHVSDQFCPLLLTFSCSLDVFVIIRFVFLVLQFCF